MTKKNLKKYAILIANQQNIIDNEKSSEDAIKDAKMKIIQYTDDLAEKSDTIEDLIIVDNMVRELLLSK